jgi:hypothetical protein
MGARVARVIGSNGEASLRGYVVATVPRPAAVPAEADERVIVTDPHRTPTVTGPPLSSGPRDPNERTWPRPETPAIELPDARPLNKAQRFWIDPELIARWDREAEERRRNGDDGGGQR